MLIIRAETHKMFVRKANREDPDQTASCFSRGVCTRISKETYRHLCDFPGEGSGPHEKWYRPLQDAA